MKQKLRYILAGAVAAVLIVAWLLIATDQDPARTQSLFSPKKSEEISSIELKNAYGSFSFSNDGRNWIVSDGRGSYLTNPQKMKLLTESLLHFKVLRMLETEKPEYGTTQPRAAVQFETNRGQKFLILVGGSCPNVSECYAKLGNKSFITDAAAVAQLTGSLAAYRTNQVFSVDFSCLKSMEYSVGGEKKITLSRPENGDWVISYPFSAGVRKLDFNEFLAGMSSWRIAGYPDDFKPLPSNEEEVLYLTDSKGQTQTIVFGAVSATERYARIGGEGDAVTLYANDADLTALTPESLIYEAPLYENINNVSSIYLNIGGEIFNAELDAKAALAAVNSRPVDYESFVGMYYRYVLLLADGWDAQPEPGEPVAQFISTLTNGEELALTLYERDEDSLYMEYAEAQSGFYLKLERLQKLCDRLEGLF